ncbi:MAG: aminodeoxychorismate/anthranilate synthase component II [Deltaproteobacteria bacterium]|nr:aminodeoxychorismate/anthranilate synthase component II [Deltaproteobacteria bacterium]MBW1927665.1 aminodeoxychorismate/anthranilate synthase component II [Deltaproteobacteria bacterium]MBW2026268.1 aminodeoxychorismate/anthranilate synthase component II [Deltaproteobacteria bacterium]MBW2126161.1 aminodeoxychorismate/anthranilate synthase component II [Deltaproteobacteria bacterium]RLB15728.1 MAG: anthranilate/aminodeoxychorismate synthase component II [Deltaproteobacteria bacterium]
MILVIDNYDSFTYNLVQMFGAMGQDVVVKRNDHIRLDEMEELRPSALVISPGPCTPKEAGISVEAVRWFAPKIPVLGVCLGHQAIATAFGCKVVKAPRIMHGKTSAVLHDGKGIYENIPNPFEATRYHSLIVDKSSLNDLLVVSAWTEEGEVMGLRHCHHNVEGVQFHPESILTPEGRRIVENFIRQNGL